MNNCASIILHTFLLAGALGERLKREYGIRFDGHINMGGLTLMPCTPRSRRYGVSCLFLDLSDRCVCRLVILQFHYHGRPVPSIGFWPEDKICKAFAGRAFPDDLVISRCREICYSKNAAQGLFVIVSQDRCVGFMCQFDQLCYFVCITVNRFVQQIVAG